MTAPYPRIQSPTPLPAARQPIDLDHLSGQTLGDPGLELEVLRLFDAMSHVYCRRIVESKTPMDTLLHLHTLRGAAAGIGAFDLAELAGAAETGLRKGIPTNPELIGDIAMAVEELSAFIGARIEAAAA